MLPYVYNWNRTLIRKHGSNLVERCPINRILGVKPYYCVRSKEECFIRTKHAEGWYKKRKTTKKPCRLIRVPQIRHQKAYSFDNETHKVTHLLILRDAHSICACTLLKIDPQ